MMRLVLSAAVCAATLALLPAAATWKPEYAQLSDQQRQWFRSQRVPGRSYSCCSEADGAQAQENIVGGGYRVRFTARRSASTDPTQVTEEDSGWMDVPAEAVIHEPNLHGLPVVWYWWKPERSLAGAPSSFTLTIRCYAPGAGL